MKSKRAVPHGRLPRTVLALLAASGCAAGCGDTHVGATSTLDGSVASGGTSGSGGATPEGGTGGALGTGSGGGGAPAGGMGQGGGNGGSAGSAPSAGGGTGSGGNVGQGGQSSSGGDSGVASSCTSSAAAFTTSDAEGQWSNGGYFIRNDAWNSDAGPQTLSACSYSSWNVVANEPSTTDVKSYPDVQMDFQRSGQGAGTGVPISSFKSLTSTFSETSPHVGIYEDAYDIFVNSNTLVGPGTTEIMIWVDNYEQAPAGQKMASAVPLDGRTYDVYFEADNGNGGHYVAFVANTNFTSGTVNILAFFDYAVSQSFIPSSAPLNQICFGVEICETNGAPATFQFTDFSIDTSQ